MGCGGSKEEEPAESGAATPQPTQVSGAAASRTRESDATPSKSSAAAGKSGVLPGKPWTSALAGAGTEDAQLARIGDAFQRAASRKDALGNVAELAAALRVLHISLDGLDTDSLFDDGQTDGVVDLTAFIVLVNRPAVAGRMGARNLRAGSGGALHHPTAGACSEVLTPAAALATPPAKTQLKRAPSEKQFAVCAEHLLEFGSALEASSTDGFVRTPFELQTALGALGKQVDGMEADVLFDIVEKERYVEGTEPCVGLQEFASLCAKIGVNPLSSASARL